MPWSLARSRPSVAWVTPVLADFTTNTFAYEFPTGTADDCLLADWALRRRTADVVDFHFGEATVVEAKRLCRPRGDVDEPVADIGASVVDAHHDRAVVGEIGHAHGAGDRQRPVRGREGIHVECFAVGCTATVEIGAVPGRHAGGAVTAVGLRSMQLRGGHCPFRVKHVLRRVRTWTDGRRIERDAPSGTRAARNVVGGASAKRKATRRQDQQMCDVAKPAVTPERAHR
jgi:hypothetical protein